jgi:hypothetical protein
MLTVGAVLWIGQNVAPAGMLGDPLDSVLTRAEADPMDEALSALMISWRSVFGDRFLSGSLLIIALHSSAFASPIGRLFKEALDGVIETTPYFAAKGARKGLTNELGSQSPEDLLRAKLEAIDEETGKMANSISNLIFIYNTPEQRLVPEKEYRRIKSQFLDKVRGSKKEQARLVFMTNLKCSAYALDLLSGFSEALASGRDLSTYREPIQDLRRCSDLLRRVKGYHIESVEGYEKLGNSFLPLFKDLKSLDSQKRREVSLFVSTMLSAMKGQHAAVEKAARDWF